MKVKVPQAKLKLKKHRNAKPRQHDTPACCLITGFGEFGEESFNPTEAITKMMPDYLELKKENRSVVIEKLVLPTSGKKAWPLLRQKLKKLNKIKICAIVLTGLASHLERLSLERFALNIRDYQIKDVGGRRPQGEMIIENGPQAIRSKLPLENLLTQLNRSGFPARISNYCGTFVCNEIYYQALYFASQHGVSCPIIFAHVPLPNTFGKTLSKEGSKTSKKMARGKKNQLEAMRLAIAELAIACCQLK